MSYSRDPIVRNVRDYGAKPDGSDARIAIQVAIDEVVAGGGGSIFFAPGTYTVGRSSTNAYSFQIGPPATNVTLYGVAGQSILRHPIGMPASSVAIVSIQNAQRVTIRDLVFDGNWGNAAARIGIQSHGRDLPQTDIYVDSTIGWPSAGSFVVNSLVGGVPTQQTVTYTSVSLNAFAGCTGGAGTLLGESRIGRVDSQAGINHASQVDPKNYGLMLRGCSNVLVDNCVFQNIYGDGIWIGGPSTTALAQQYAGCVDVRIQNTTINLCARSGIALGGQADGVHIRDCRLENIFATALDTEPGGGGQGSYARDVHLTGCLLDGWWNPLGAGRNVNSPLSISGGGGIVAPLDANYARGYRVTDCTINGGIQITTAFDVQISRCRIVCDVKGASGYGPVTIQGSGDDIWITDNEIYGSTLNSQSIVQALVVVAGYPAGTIWPQPQGVHISRNRIYPKAGNSGVLVQATGGNPGDAGTTTGINGSYLGTATAITATTLTDPSGPWSGVSLVGALVVVKVGSNSLIATITSSSSTVLTFSGGWNGATPAPSAYAITASLTDGSKSWSVDQWQNHRIIVGATQGVITGNTATVLAINIFNGTDPFSWRQPLGAPALTPPAGTAYVIQPRTSTVYVDDNVIDLSDNGHGRGVCGVTVTALKAGMRVAVRRNEVVAATGAAIEIGCTDSSRPFVSLEVTDNVGRDNQTTPTMTSCVHVSLPSGTFAQNIPRGVLRNNRVDGGSSAVPVAGVANGRWLVNDGQFAEWAGFGTPETFVTAGIGSTYHRLDGGAATCLYVKESGAAATGWIAK